MLEATSLAVQPDYVLTLAPAHLRFIIYVVNVTQIPRSGGGTGCRLPCHSSRRHNAHRENPAGVIASLAQILLSD